MFLNVDYNIYSELLHHYFPPEGSGAGGKEKEGERVEEEREERSTGETDGVGSPSTPLAGDKEPTTAAAATGEERETEIDVPILRKSITEPGIYICEPKLCKRHRIICTSSPHTGIYTCCIRTCTK